MNPNFFNTRCVQELNESTPAAHVLSVCAYFPNLDMGSELQALRVYVKLAWLSPFHSPDPAVAQHRDAPRHWDCWLQRASCPKLACVGQAGLRGALAHLSRPHTGSSREEKVLLWPLFSAPGRSLAPVLCSWVDLDELFAPLLSSFGWRIAASMDGSALKGEQLYGVVSMLVGCPCMWGEERQSTCFSPLGDKVLRATWSLALWEEKLQFFESTTCCQKSLSISDHRLEMKAASLFFYLSFCRAAASGHLAPPCRRVGGSGGSQQEGTSPKRQSDLARGHTQEQEQLPRWPPEPH